MSRQEFGCARCWPEPADSAWAAQASLSTESQLVDESHFRVAVRRCNGCSQRFLWIFTETVDFTHGEDPQYWTIIPVTAEEVATLSSGDPPSEGALSAIGPDRRSLLRNHPSSGTLACSWSTGVGLLMHD